MWRSQKKSVTNQIYRRTKWYDIFIAFSLDTTKQFQIWASKTRQLLIGTDPYIDESKQGAKLLINHPLQSLKQKLPTSKPRPRGRPRKVVQIEENYVAPSLHNALADMDEPQADTAMFATEVGSKIYEPRTYDKAIADPVHGRKWKDAIEEELSNLE